MKKVLNWKIWDHFVIAKPAEKLVSQSYITLRWSRSKIWFFLSFLLTIGNQPFGQNAYVNTICLKSNVCIGHKHDPRHLSRLKLNNAMTKREVESKWQKFLPKPKEWCTKFLDQEHHQVSTIFLQVKYYFFFLDLWLDFKAF